MVYPLYMLYTRNIYHKMIRGKLLRVVVKTNVVITVYHTSKIGKYWKGK